jgi:hypothetical protein
MEGGGRLRGQETTHIHQLVELTRFMRETDKGMDAASLLRHTWQTRGGQGGGVIREPVDDGQ